MIVALVALLGACAGSASSPGTKAPKKTTDYSTYATLADVFRTVGGLTVKGSGQNIQVLVRGGAQNSISLSSLPLFVVDRMPIGTAYADVASIVNPVDVASVKVLVGSRAFTVYGEQGNAGVIEIKTKRMK